MSGMPHPATVRCTLDGKTSNDCGGAPKDLLPGDEWRVSSIAGKAVLENATPTIEFLAEDNRVAGLAGCNRFIGTFELTGENLRISPLGVTMMACAQSGVQEQGGRFLELLQKTVRFKVPGFGRLHLVTSDNETIEASR
ncbi:MAG: META domain-containing protein [Wenzhouxiangellaceae bacterium]